MKIKERVLILLSRKIKEIEDDDFKSALYNLRGYVATGQASFYMLDKLENAIIFSKNGELLQMAKKTYKRKEKIIKGVLWSQTQ